MADALRKKRSVRKGYREVLTKRLGEGNVLLEGIATDREVDSVKLGQLKLFVNEKLLVLKKLDEEIIDLIDGDEEIVQEISETDQYNENAYNSLAKIETYLADKARKVPSASVHASDVSSKTKLPKLDLPVFKGDVTEWIAFWDLYVVSVHTNPSLSPIEKFTYLRTLVSHTAKDAIAGLALSAINYDEAIDILQRRFGNKEKIIAKHMEALLSLDNPASSSLRVLHDKIESHTRQLKALGVPEEAYNCLLPSLVMKRLPKDIALSISRRIPEDNWNLASIMKELDDELKVRERTYDKSGHSNDHKRFESNYRRSREQPTAAALLTNVSHCCYCRETHPAEECAKMPKVEERKQFLRNSGRCFVCMKQGHLSRQCKSNNRCKRCHGRHHTSICFKTASKEVNEKQSEETNLLNPDAPPFKSNTLLTEANGPILLQTAPALLHNLERSRNMTVKVIFDNGSQRSYITERARSVLSLRTVGRKELLISTFAACTSSKRTCDVVKAILETKEGEEVLLSLLTTPLICEPITYSSIGQSICKYPHLQGIDLADPAVEGETIEFDVLIGLDHYWDIITGETIRGTSGPTAVYSKLGWILSGPTLTESTSLMTHVLTTGVRAIENKSRLDDQLKSFWNLESLGILEEEATLFEQFKEQVTFDGIRYVVTLPWRDDVSLRSDNYDLSLSRLKGLLRRMRGNPSLLDEYHKSITSQIENGIVEVVEDPTVIVGERVYYLPHHAVIRHDKQSTKLRVVFDASAKTNGPSLNDCLHSGPKFNQKILEILIRFRVHANAFIADVEKAFLMIGVHEPDRDVLRFLWVKDPQQEPLDILVMRFKRVTFGVTASPFLLNATIRHHIEKFKDNNPELVENLLRSVYVDDIISGTESKEKSLKKFECFREMLAVGGFNLRKFISSGSDSESAGEVRKVLGVTWRVTQDELVVDLSHIAKEANTHNPTKRHIVSVVSKIYDPIGLVSPVTVQFKILLQELHRSGSDWDEKINQDMLVCWIKLISSINVGQPVIVPRCYFANKTNDCQLKLVGFCDASIKAYAAVIYLQCSNGISKRMTFVASKTRVAPAKRQTVPRLELLGALLLARLIACVHEALKPELTLSTPLCYTDSQVVLCWIKGTAREWKPFVFNRIREIKGLVPSENWRHCAGECNPADIPSRGSSFDTLSDKVLWWNGPAELQEIIEMPAEIPSDCLAELRVTTCKEYGLLSGEGVGKGISSVIEFKSYSSFIQLIRVTAYVLRLVECMKSGNGNRELAVLMDKAEVMWIKEIQTQLVEDHNFQKWKSQLQLYVDSLGIWRCRGRLMNADLPYHTKHPIVLPGWHFITTLLIRRAHERVFHNGVKETLNELRARFWVLRGRSAVRKEVHKCVLCRKLEGLAYAAPQMPPLPAFRVSEEPPFSFTGIDFAGPLFVKSSKYEHEGKVWLCLYTCCVTRAIHLDVLRNMSFEYFFRSFQRFVARRGLPRRVVSDNAKTFKGAARLFQEIMNRKDAHHYLPEYKIRWDFNVERSPWWGGVFERLVRSTKRCLKKIIGRAKLTNEELLTVVTEIEMIINCRPLSYITQDDMDEPITPSHLLIGRRIISLPDNLCYETEQEITLTSKLLTHRMMYLNRTLNQFWSRWKKEYLLELREAHRVYTSYSSARESVQTGDVVVIHDDIKRRNFWNIGKIEELIKGRDGEVRAARVRVYNGQGKSHLLNRPVQKLYPIEVNDQYAESEIVAENEQSQSVNDDPPVSVICNDSETTTEECTLRQEISEVKVPSRSSKRRAAIAARESIRAQSFA